MALGALFVLFGFGLACVTFALWMWALVDSLRVPEWRWQQAGQSKLLWVLVIVFLHVLGALLYAVIARPTVRPRLA